MKEGRRTAEQADLRRDQVKYGCRNPIGRALVARFTAHLEQRVSSLESAEVLDVGCSDGRLIGQLAPRLGGASIVACDISLTALADAPRRTPSVQFVAASAYALPFSDKSFGTVLAFEVLEHLEFPEQALLEIARVCRRYVMLSVPHEPLWRWLNLARGKYVRHFGNTPGHLQHWTAGSFVRLVGQHFRVTRVARVLPWTVVTAEAQTD